VGGAGSTDGARLTPKYRYQCFDISVFNAGGGIETTYVAVK